MNEPICFHGWVSGRVQGVYFRRFTADAAEAEGVEGWARNLSDGRVEFMLCGQRAAVARVLDQLRQGPPSARVDTLEYREQSWCEQDGFSIR